MIPMSKISDKLKTRALKTAEKHLETREGESGINARANNEIQGVIAFLKANGYDTHIIEATLTELGYDEGLISYHLLTPIKNPDEMIKELEESGHLVPGEPNPIEPPPPLSEDVAEEIKDAADSIDNAMGVGSEPDPDDLPEGTPEE